MQAKISNHLLLCAMLSTGMVAGMENFTKKVIEIYEEEILTVLPQPHPDYGKPLEIIGDTPPSYEEFASKLKAWCSNQESSCMRIPIPKGGALLKILTPSWTSGSMDLDIAHEIIRVKLERTKEDHNKIEVKGSYYNVEEKRVEEKLLATLLIPSKVD